NFSLRQTDKKIGLGRFSKLCLIKGCERLSGDAPHQLISERPDCKGMIAMGRAGVPQGKLVRQALGQFFMAEKLGQTEAAIHCNKTGLMGHKLAYRNKLLAGR